MRFNHPLDLRNPKAQVNESSYVWTLPQADVFYYWGTPPTNLQMVRWIDEAMRARRAVGTAFLGFDWLYPPDRSSMVEQLLALRAAKGNESVILRRILFDESNGREDLEPPPNEGGGGGREDVEPEDGDGRTRRRPSYLRPFARRSGQWGVFHVIGVRVGEGTLRLPRRMLDT